jgi:hypothetical protein
MPTSTIDKGSKEEFLDVYNKHLPNKWIKFAFRYFSTSTIDKDLWLKKTMIGVMITLMLLGLLISILNLKWVFSACIVLTLAAIFLSLGTLLFGALIMNNFRIRKIRKILGITKEEYDFLVQVYVE